MVCATFSPVLTGTVLLSTTMRYSLMWIGDLARDALDEAKVDAAIGLRRGGHGDEDDRAKPSTASPMEAVKLRRPAATFFLHQFLEPRLVNGNLPVLERVHLLQVVVDADDRVAHFGRSGARDQSDIARADNR